MKKIKFFGHNFSEAGISPDPNKINAIKAMKMPENVK